MQASHGQENWKITVKTHFKIQTFYQLVKVSNMNKQSTTVQAG